MANQDKNISTFPTALTDGFVIGVAGGSGKNFDTRLWSMNRLKGLKIITGTTYTLSLADEAFILQFTNSGAITVTLPTNTAVAWPPFGGCKMLRSGTGQITVVAASGASLIAGGRPKFRVTGSIAEVYKIDESTWIMSGDCIA